MIAHSHIALSAWMCPVSSTFTWHDYDKRGSTCSGSTGWTLVYSHTRSKTSWLNAYIPNTGGWKPRWLQLRQRTHLSPSVRETSFILITDKSFQIKSAPTYRGQLVLCTAHMVLSVLAASGITPTKFTHGAAFRFPPFSTSFETQHHYQLLPKGKGHPLSGTSSTYHMHVHTDPWSAE